MAEGEYVRIATGKSAKFIRNDEEIKQRLANIFKICQSFEIYLEKLITTVCYMWLYQWSYFAALPAKNAWSEGLHGNLSLQNVSEFICSSRKAAHWSCTPLFNIRESTVALIELRCVFMQLFPNGNDISVIRCSITAFICESIGIMSIPRHITRGFTRWIALGEVLLLGCFKR